MQFSLIIVAIIGAFFINPVKAEFSTEYYLDVQNVSGGKTPATAAQGNLFLSYKHNVKNGQFRSSLIATHGETPAEFVGDLQTTSNLDSGGVETVKVFELAYAHKWNKLILLGGMQDLSRDFNVSEPASFFIHSSPGTSAELAAAGKFGTAFNPFSALGLSGFWELNKNYKLKFSGTDATPFYPDEPFATQMNLTSDDGIFYLSELVYEEKDKFKMGLGYWWFTEEEDKGFYLMGDYNHSATFHPFVRFGKSTHHSQSFESNFVTGFTSVNWGGHVFKA